MTGIASPLGRLLSVKDAADRLGMDEATARREIRAKRLQVLRRGRALGVYERWCADYVARQSDAPHVEESRVETTAASTSQPSAAGRAATIRQMAKGLPSLGVH